MTTKQADRIIAAGKPVTVRDSYGETFVALFVSRDRRMIRTDTGGVFERADLALIETTGSK